MSGTGQQPTVSPLTAEQFRATAAAIEREVGKVIVGQRELVRHTLITLLAGGNALLEGVPGLGKTMLIRTLAQVIDCTFSRHRRGRERAAHLSLRGGAYLR